ncbi:LytR/AlgR family response regulator transcription factor [Marinilabilia rubra]|uniref:DNA-binding response regulator n=1 Tax=Marinilabilia rubra TaxID=2162893 RepID=A0A2U2BD12_9BACT|nr:LytTR family DNA-binding domain-containing protein [Marinilabilia rubra]PWE00951.1 DNA-binding response regulator [Marinilabilia rubra]
MKKQQHKCIIIDDEPIAIRIIREHLEPFESLECLGGFTNPLKAMEFLSSEKVDLIFLDINMPGLSGIDLFKSLAHKPQIIFTTAYREYAVDAFDLDAVDYLVKPVPFERFVKAINKFLEIANEQGFSYDKTQEKAYIILKSDKKHHKVAFSDITIIESLDNYIKIHNQNTGSLVCYESLSAIEQKLPKNDFLRIHRSFIVNIHHIKAFTASYVEIGDRKLTIGRNYKEEVAKRL